MIGKADITMLISSGAINFKSTNDLYPFSISDQVSNDSVDLRLGEYFYKMQFNHEYINTLDPDKEVLSKVFQKNVLTGIGYVLQPNEIIFAPTLEVVKMGSSRYYGYVNGRSLYARFGLSVNCTFTKHGYGMNAIVSLQIKNNSPVPLRIFPRQKIVQLEIHEITGNMREYDGDYREELNYMIPEKKDKELKQYSETDIALITSLKPRSIKSEKASFSTNNIQSYLKIKSLVTGILGPSSLATFIFITIDSQNGYYLILILFSLLCIADFIYSILKLQNEGNDGE